MRASEFLSLYTSDSWLRTLSADILAPGPTATRIKGLSGSLDALVFSALYKIQPKPCLVVLSDREEASYFQNDLQNLLEKEILFFPMSYKRPYEFEETENANILLRAEVLNRLATTTGSEIIVTYPDALSEKVISKRTLVSNTFQINVGETLDIGFLEEFFHTYNFERTEFVYEAGQFAVRGGIIDVFSFANEYPLRIELFGNEVDRICTFDPISQLSVVSLSHVNVLPNVQDKINVEERQSLLDFILPDTQLWFKDVDLTLDVIQEYFEKAQVAYENNRSKSNSTLLLEPTSLFIDKSSFAGQSFSFSRIGFGNKPCFPNEKTFDFNSSGQPSFNKNFDLLAKDLEDHHLRGYQNFIATDLPKQTERLKGIFDEINPQAVFMSLGFPLRGGFVDHSLKFVCYTDHQIFERFHRYKAKEKFTRSKALTLKELQLLKPGDFVTHIEYGIGKFVGLEKRMVNGHDQEAIRLVFRDDDLLYVSLHSLHKISKYSGREGTPPVMSKLGSQEWENKKAKAKSRVKDIAKELISLYAKRKSISGFAFSPDNFLQAELESSFIYEDTPDQARATEEVKKDMELPHPMDRLICGDVGFGKTEVAIRAAFKSVSNGKQVAVLVPTTILAFQHFRTFKERLSSFPISIQYISRFRSDKDIRKTLDETKDGQINILIGTHRIVGKDVHFKDLGLLIVDEEQKFGVKTKERLKEFKVNVDVLTLTATPIPRTLHFSLMGARDLSIIATAPPNRQPVTTELHTFNEALIRDSVSFELKRGGQVFFVHNRVADIEEVANIIVHLVPDARIGVAHGQMEGDRLERTMLKFIDHEYDVLISTNIIESGLDIPNANTIIINQAHMFGLSDLHQMRGRVGRSNKKAFCFLLTPPTAALSSESRKRLSALEEFSELGDGFKVAMRDLDIRGAGNLLGGEQSGFINDLGFETYHKILDEAVQELKEEEFKDLFSSSLTEKIKNIFPDCLIETDLEILIPDSYVKNTTERFQLYTRLDNIEEESDLLKFSDELKDRFGPLPVSVVDLIQSIRLRWIGGKLGFEKITLKNAVLKGQFISKRESYFQSDVFGKIIRFVQQNPKKCAIREKGGNALIHVERIQSVDQALDFLSMVYTTEESSLRETLSK